MRQRNDLEIFIELSIYEDERKMTKRELTYAPARRNPAHGFADRRVGGDQLDRGLNRVPEPAP